MMSLLELAGALGKVAADINRDMKGDRVFEKPCELLKTEIQSAIGSYKYAWPSLAESTLARKAGNTPLLETGEFRASFSFKIGHGEAWVGTNDFRAIWFEMGTIHMPPRPYLEPALHAQHNNIEAAFGDFIKVTVERAI